ncbi:hypothetical protein ACHQM5_022411 [Ranunculus cassubicifolius]
MLLGKRPRPHIKRTTSITEFTVDLGYLEEPTSPSDQHNLARFMTQSSPRTRRSSADFYEPAHFLRTCGLCNRRLAPGRDIFMYRGDTAFCSSECRQQQMNQDERKEKCSSMASSNQGGSIAAV